MTGWLSHLIVLPILLPLAVGAGMLLFNERRRRLKQVLALATSLALVAISIAMLCLMAGAEDGTGGTPWVYLLGNWPAPFGIVLVADRLSVLMLVVTSIVGLASLFYAIARWDASGPRFHALFLFLLMGVNGAFLTGDLFNLFVFFEVLLAASYGLALHGGGVARVKASLHYISINVATSLLFLIGVSMIYAVTGTLNMADLADRLARVAVQDRALLQGGMAILGVAFLVKAGMWPLNFWLPATYGVASPPAAAVFAILTKVGVYIVLRLSSLLFPEQSDFAPVFAAEWLQYGGMATMAFASLALLASQNLTRLAGCYLLVATGTLLAAVGFGGQAVVAGLLFYLVISTFASCALYLIIEAVERNAVDEKISSTSEPVFEDEYVGVFDEEQETEIGTAIPATVALLGGGFILVALLLAGLPPLPAFLAKFAIIDGLLRLPGGTDTAEWTMIALMLIAGLAALITMSRAGIELLWTPSDRPPVRLNIIEAVPVGMLLALCVALTVWAGPAMSYMTSTAEALSEPASYVNAVRSQARIPTSAP